MDGWFNTTSRISKLQEVADSWLGTPFAANSRCKGKRGGVSCQMLAEQIYLECGIDLPFKAERGSMKWCGVSTSSLIEKFVDSQRIFYAVDCGWKDAQAGDLVGFSIGGCLHHLGVALGEGRFIHCMRGNTTTICRLSDPTFTKRVAKIWRITE